MYPGICVTDMAATTTSPKTHQQLQHATVMLVREPNPTERSAPMQLRCPVLIRLRNFGTISDRKASIHSSDFDCRRTTGYEQALRFLFWSPLRKCQTNNLNIGLYPQPKVAIYRHESTVFSALSLYHIPASLLCRAQSLSEFHHHDRLKKERRSSLTRGLAESEHIARLRSS